MNIKFFVQIIGPYDCTVVGPFDTSEAVNAFMATVPKNFDKWLMTERALDDNFVEFGPMKIESPDTYKFGERYVDPDLDWLKKE